MKITVSRLKELINEELKLANEGSVPPSVQPPQPKKKYPGNMPPTNPHDEPVELEESPGHKRGPHAKQGRRATLDSGERVELEESPGHKRGPHAKQGRRATLDSGEREELISEEHSGWPYPEEHGSGEFPRGLAPAGLDVLTQLNMPPFEGPAMPTREPYSRGNLQPSWEDALAQDRAGYSAWNPQAWGIDTPYPKGTEWGPLSLEEKRRYPGRLEGHPTGPNRIRLEEQVPPYDEFPTPVPGPDFPMPPGPRPGAIPFPEVLPGMPAPYPERELEPGQEQEDWSLEEQVAKVVDYYTNQIMENKTMKETSPEYQARLNEEDQEDVFPSKQLPTKKVKPGEKKEKKVKPPSLEEHVAAYIDQVMEQTIKDIGGGRQAECGPDSCRILPRKDKPKPPPKETPDGAAGAPLEQSTGTVKEQEKKEGLGIPGLGKAETQEKVPKVKFTDKKKKITPLGDTKESVESEEPVLDESEEPGLEVNETLAGWYNKTLFESLAKKWAK